VGLDGIFVPYCDEAVELRCRPACSIPRSTSSPHLAEDAQDLVIDALRDALAA
jgi:hypothetical protein